MIRILLLSFILLVSPVFAEEVITKYDEQSLAVLNDILRTLTDKSYNIQEDVDAIVDEKVKASSDDPTADYLDAKVKNSIEEDSEDLQLVNDESAPGNNKLYGTNASGTKGWYAHVNVVTYTGNGVDNRNIAHGLGKTPVFVWIAQYSSTAHSCFWISGMGSTSKDTSGNISANGIQSVGATNVQVGTDTQVNSNGASYVMFVI